MDARLQQALEEMDEHLGIVLTDKGEARWEELKAKRFVNCTTQERGEWDVLFDMLDPSSHRLTDLTVWALLTPGRDSAIGYYLLKNTTQRMAWVMNHVSDLIDAGYLALGELKK